jgi:hypothetical protein
LENDSTAEVLETLGIVLDYATVDDVYDDTSDDEQVR